MQEIVLYGASWCGDCHRTKSFLDSHDITYQYLNIEESQEAADKVVEINSGNRSIPTIVFEDGSHLTEPTNDELSKKLQELGII